MRTFCAKIWSGVSKEKLKMLKFLTGAVLGKIEKTPEMHNNSVIIAAGGSGSRMNSDVPKQFIEIGGKPVLVRTAELFNNCGFIDEIIIVCRHSELQTVKALTKRYGLKKVKKIVSGGSTRQRSVYNGLMKVSPDAEYIAIHDAARCLITEEAVRSVFKAAYRYGAATASSSVKDTIKVSNGKGFVEYTPERSTLRAVQTPQIFKKELIIAAHELARREEYEATDDNALVEKTGVRVRLVDCGHTNIKLTTPEDIAVAEALLEFSTGKAEEK